ncbi:MAG: DUF6526 family protein [Vicinamibacterales bacterium]
MTEQSYRHHARLVPLYHFVLSPMLLLGLIGSGVNLYQSIGDSERLYSAALIVWLFVVVVLTALFARSFALKAQDRVIRTEERLRHFIMTGQPLDPRLTTDQLIGLRFAGDEEFLALAREAVEGGLARDDIKQRVRAWRADHDRL